jgi:hypothetical protein
MSNDFLSDALRADDDMADVVSVIFDVKLKEGEEEVDDKGRLHVGVGAKVRGIVLDTGTFEGNFGPVRTFAVKDADRNRTLRLFASGTILSKDLADAVEGDFIAVTFLGKTKTKGGDVEYANYNVLHRQAPRTVLESTPAVTVPSESDYEPEPF